MNTTNLFNTLIQVADDCPVASAEVPQQKGKEKTVAVIQFEMIAKNPYEYTSDDVVFTTYALRKDIGPHEMDEEREKFFSKGQACLRASPLAKRFGWGIHSDGEGKVALYAFESEEYQQLANDQSIKKVMAMRSKRR